MTSQGTRFTSNRRATRSSFAVAGAGNFGRNQNTVAFSSKTKLGPVAHTVIVALMIALLGLLYLTQLTKTSEFGYQLNDIQSQHDDLAIQKQDLEVENARLQAYSRVKNSDVAARMTIPSSVDYAN